MNANFISFIVISLANACLAKARPACDTEYMRSCHRIRWAYCTLSKGHYSYGWQCDCSCYICYSSFLPTKSAIASYANTCHLTTQWTRTLRRCDTIVCPSACSDSCYSSCVVLESRAQMWSPIWTPAIISASPILESDAAIIYTDIAFVLNNRRPSQKAWSSVPCSNHLNMICQCRSWNKWCTRLSLRGSCQARRLNLCEYGSSRPWAKCWKFLSGCYLGGWFINSSAD